MKLTKINKKLPPIISIALVGILLAIIAFAVKTQNDITSTQPQIITGSIASTSNECNVDGVCSVTLKSGQKIITGCGLSAGGKTCKIYNQSKLRLGQQVEATVMHQEGATYNLECSTCTIRPLN